MMTRYTFDEIKNFKVGDIFYSQNKRFSVDSDPTYYNNSEFYGDYSEKVEWTGICEAIDDAESNRQHLFVVQSNQQDGEAPEYLIFKDLDGEV